jgi:hypothetical protein
MLLWQTVHEPDPIGRAGALLTLADACSAPAECPDLSALLRERAVEDPARIVRQMAERTLQRLSGSQP